MFATIRKVSRAPLYSRSLGEKMENQLVYRFDIEIDKKEIWQRWIVANNLLSAKGKLNEEMQKAFPRLKYAIKSWRAYQ